MRTNVDAPNIGGFGDRLWRKIIWQRLKYDHLSGKKLAVIPLELRQKCSRRHRIDTLDRVRTQNVERAICHEFGEGASVEPEKLPNPRECALNFDLKLFAGEVC